MIKNHTPYLLFLALLILSACGTPRAGLQGEYPPQQQSTFALFGEFTETESLSPTLRWQTVGQVLMEKNERDIDRSSLTEITYELRIWQTATEYSGILIYSRMGLETPYHMLEEPLKTDTKYLWSVRAHYLVDGKSRLSEWGMSGYLLQDEPVPNPACFRFKTP